MAAEKTALLGGKYLVSAPLPFLWTERSWGVGVKVEVPPGRGGGSNDPNKIRTNIPRHNGDSDSIGFDWSIYRWNIQSKKKSVGPTNLLIS